MKILTRVLTVTVEVAEKAWDEHHPAQSFDQYMDSKGPLIGDVMLDVLRSVETAHGLVHVAIDEVEER